MLKKSDVELFEQAIADGRITWMDYYRQVAYMESVAREDFKLEAVGTFIAVVVGYSLLGGLGAVALGLMGVQMIWDKIKYGDQADLDISEGKLDKYLPPAEQRAYREWLANASVKELPQASSEPTDNPTPQRPVQGHPDAVTDTTVINARNPFEAESSPSIQTKSPIELITARNTDGFYRSWFICGLPGAGKGTLIALAARELQEKIKAEVWLIDPKNEVREDYYWDFIPKSRKLRFQVDDPQLGNAECEAMVHGFLCQFHESQAQPKVLVVDELPALVSKFSPKYAKTFRGYISQIASMGRARDRIVIVSTQAVGVVANELTISSQGSFAEMYLVSAETYRKIVSHPSYKWNQSVPLNLLGDRRRAFLSSTTNRWEQVPTTYPQLLGTKSPETVRLDPNSEIQLGARIQQVRFKEKSEAELYNKLFEEPHPTLQNYEVKSIFDDLAKEKYPKHPLMSDFIMWLKTKQDESLTRRQIVRLWGMKKDRNLTTNDAIQSYLSEAIAIGLLLEDEDEFIVLLED